MLLFISTFTIFTLTNIFFENIKISFISFLVIILSTLLFFLIKYKTRFYKKWKYFLIITISFLVSLIAIIIKINSYDQNLLNKFLNNDYHHQTWLTYLIWTWIIDDTYSFGKYIFQNSSWDKYILNSQKSYQIWDQLRLVWYQKDIDIDWSTNFSWILDREFDYDKRLIMKWFHGNIYEQNSINLGQKNKIALSSALADSSQWQIDSQWLWYIKNLKRNLQSKIISAYWNNRNAGLILWMLIWDKSQIPKEDYQSFIDSGLVHIIAVSGGNIIMIVVFLSFVLFFLPFYFRNFVILLSIILYSMICGMDSSVFRAILFAWMSIWALFIGKETNFRRSVLIVYIVMLLYNPYFLLYDLGFLLSFWAVIGIRVFTDLSCFSLCHSEQSEESSKILNKNLDSSLYSEWQIFKRHALWLVKKIYNNYIKPSLWANIWIFPIIIFFMWKINLIWFISNLFVLPIVPILMIYGFLSIFLYQVFPFQIFLNIQIRLTDYIFWVSNLSSKYWIYLLVESPWLKYLILFLFLTLLIFNRLKNIKNTKKVQKI